MADNTGIEWCDATWNPVVGCSLVSPGCTHCYAMKTAAGLERRFGSAKYGGLTRVVNGNPVWTGEVRLDEGALDQPLRWRRPRRIFVNSMSDLFHESLPDAAIDRVFAIMALARQHTFLVLTKRAARMRQYMKSRFGNEFDMHVSDAMLSITHSLSEGHQQAAADQTDCGRPLPNVWLGVSVEDQARADERIPLLLETPAAVRFLSCEPLLGPIDLRLPDDGECCCDHAARAALGAAPAGPLAASHTPLCPHATRPDWVIVGGESGPGARPMHPDWARSLRDQCHAGGVPFFFKQWGDWADEGWATAHGHAPGDSMFDAEGRPHGPRWHFYDVHDRCGGAMIRVGKRAAGRHLDGRKWSEFPAPRQD